jgi:hypothetical protein
MVAMQSGIILQWFEYGIGMREVANRVPQRLAS